MATKTTKNENQTVVAIADAIAQISDFLAVKHPSAASQTIVGDGFTASLDAFQSHQAMAAKFFNIHDDGGKVKNAVTARSERCGKAISQWRLATLSFAGGVKTSVLGVTALDENRAEHNIILPMEKILLSLTDPETLVKSLDPAEVNAIYRKLPFVPTIDDTKAAYPLLETLAVPGVELVLLSENSVSAIFTSAEGFTSFFEAAAALPEAANVRVTSGLISFRAKGTDDLFSAMPVGTFNNVMLKDLANFEAFTSIAFVKTVPAAAA